MGTKKICISEKKFNNFKKKTSNFQSEQTTSDVFHSSFHKIFKVWRENFDVVLEKLDYSYYGYPDRDLNNEGDPLSVSLSRLGVLLDRVIIFFFHFFEGFFHFFEVFFVS